MSPVWGTIPPVKVGMGHADWWKVSVFHKKEYWKRKQAPFGCKCGCGVDCECTKETNCGCDCWEKKR